MRRCPHSTAGPDRYSHTAFFKKRASPVPHREAKLTLFFVHPTKVKPSHAPSMNRTSLRKRTVALLPLGPRIYSGPQ